MATSQASEKLSYRIFDPGAPSEENNFVWPQVEGSNIPTDAVFSENELDIFPAEINKDIQLFLNDATFVTDVLSENIFLRNGVLASDRFCDALVHSHISRYKKYSVIVINKKQRYEYIWLDIPQIEGKYIDYCKSSMIVSYFDGRSEPLEAMSEEKTKAVTNDLANSAKGVIKYKQLFLMKDMSNLICCQLTRQILYTIFLHASPRSYVVKTLPDLSSNKQCLQFGLLFLNPGVALKFHSTILDVHIDGG